MSITPSTPTTPTPTTRIGAAEVQLELAGQTLSIRAGGFAEQASGAVIIRMGDTMLLVTAVGTKKPREGVDFFPLTCDFEEKLYAAGKIPGSFIRREGRPSEHGVLSSRLIDRPTRPLFPKGYRNDVQVVATVLSVDQENDPSTLAIIGASAALTISDIPFLGPTAAVRIGMTSGELVINPSISKISESELDLVVAGTKDAVIMVEAGAREVSEATILRAIALAHEQIKRLVSLQEELQRQVGKPKLEVPVPTTDAEIETAVRQYAAQRLDQALFQSDKVLRENALDELRAEAQAQFSERFPDRLEEVGRAFEAQLKERVREKILAEGIRPDGRRPKEIRKLSALVSVLPRTHGSALFTRGQTQALTSATLGTVADQQRLDGLGLDEFKRYMHHYNFPPYSVGEARPLRAAGRREIGHGALAERALLPVIPSVEEYPYTIRLVTEILSSNGSTSMASVCGSSLALMDAGVPTRAQVAGVAMGLVAGNDGRFAVLTDIQGIEDNLGDMDFKVAGTASGITAMQMDVKAKGLSPAILEQALEQAREARLVVLEVMNTSLPRPRAEMSPFAPRIITFTIHPDKIREVIGPGGKMIRKIIEETGVTIDIEDDGRVFVGSTNPAASDLAIKRIKELTDEVEVGQVYRGKVVRLMPFGAFVELTAHQDGLVHISQLEDTRVERVEDSVNVGDIVVVKVVEIDEKGRVNLSRKQVPAAARAELGGEVIAPKVPRPAGEAAPSYSGSGGGYGNRSGRDRGGRSRR